MAIDLNQSGGLTEQHHHPHSHVTRMSKNLPTSYSEKLNCSYSGETTQQSIFEVTSTHMETANT